MEFQSRTKNFLLNKKTRTAILSSHLLLIGTGLLIMLTACAPATPAVVNQTDEPNVLADVAQSATPAPTSSPTESPATATVAPSPTPLPLSPVVMQALRDAFNCLTNNLAFAPNIALTHFCPGYWNSTATNMYKLDGVMIRNELEPYLSPLSNLRWRFTSLTDVQKDERLSTSVNQVYTATLSTTLTGEVNLKCPSGTPAPFRTTVSIPISGEARISVYNYLNQAQETIQIESWNIQGDPLKDYCSTLH